MKFLLNKLCVALLLTSLSACDNKNNQFRYKMMVEISTPEGIRQGSSIIEENYYRNISILGPENSVIYTKFRGSAAVIPVSNHKFLFALLRKSENEADVTHYAHAAFKNSPSFQSLNWTQKIEYIKNNLKNKNLSKDDFPMIVYFENLRDMRTVKKIDTNKYKVLSVILDITDDVPSFGIDNILPWISKIPKGYLSQKRSGKDYLLKKLDTGDFERK